MDSICEIDLGFAELLKGFEILLDLGVAHRTRGTGDRLGCIELRLGDRCRVAAVGLCPAMDEPILGLIRGFKVIQLVLGQRDHELRPSSIDGLLQWFSGIDPGCGCRDSPSVVCRRLVQCQLSGRGDCIDLVFESSLGNCIGSRAIQLGSTPSQLCIKPTQFDALKLGSLDIFKRNFG